MACTCLSVGVIDLQDLYNLHDLYDLPEWDLCDLYVLYTGLGYVRSTCYAHFYRWICVICRICMICGIFVWTEGTVKSGYFTLICIMFSRDGSVCGGYFTGVSWVGSAWSVHLYRVGSVCSSGCVWSICRIYMIYLSVICVIWMICTSWPRCGLYDLQKLSDIQDFCIIWRICKNWILHTCFSMFSNNRSRKISNRVAWAKVKEG